MNKFLCFLCVVLGSSLSGCVSNDLVKDVYGSVERYSVIGKKGQKNEAVNYDENFSFESADVKLDPIDGVYLDRIGEFWDCNSMLGVKVESTLGSKNHKYFLLAESVSNKIKTILECDFDMPIHITKGKVYNAFAMKSGIYLSEALFEDSEYEDELAFIISHEMIHFILRHSDVTLGLENAPSVYKEGEMESVFSSIYRITGKKISKSKMDEFSDMQESINSFERKQKLYAKKMEHESYADIFAIDLVAKAGYSLNGVSVALGRLKACNGFKSGDLDRKVDVFRKETNTLNSYGASLFKTMESGLDIYGGHMPFPYREKYVSLYIKEKYPLERRKVMKELVLK